MIFDMQLENGALSLHAKSLFLTSTKFLFADFVKKMTPLTAKSALLESHKSDLSIDVLNLICLLILYDPPE